MFDTVVYTLLPYIYEIFELMFKSFFRHGIVPSEGKKAKNFEQSPYYSKTKLHVYIFHKQQRNVFSSVAI